MAQSVAEERGDVGNPGLGETPCEVSLGHD